MMHKEPEKPLFTIPTETSWHFERTLKPNDKTIGNYVLIQPGAVDIAKVLKAYFHHPVEGHNIASIDIIYNASLNREFLARMHRMSRRKGNPKFLPSWKSGFRDQDKQQREDTHKLLQKISEEYRDPEMPDIMILPLWHGTSDSVAEHIFDGGYGIFTSNSLKVVTDRGYFGKGLYGAHEAEYAYRSYAKKHGDKAVLLLNWASIFEAYPIIGKDGLTFEGKTKGHDECDAHFIPVYSNMHPNTDLYLPCALHEKNQYIEVVVFNEAQFLPRYRVKLIQSIPKHGIDNGALMDYQSALDSFKLGRYGRVSETFEEACDAGHPAAAIRLHWLHSGASGVIPADLEELQKYQNPPKSSVEWVKHKANFRGENDRESQFNLAWCHLHGLGTPINLAKAAQYFWMAAVQGHREAQYQLGVCCSVGIGVKQDMSKAIYYYEQAAGQGHIHAHYLLSQCYEFGLAVIPNAAKAQMHKQAAQKGNHPKLAGMPLIAPVINTEDKKIIMQLEQKLKEKIEENKQQKINSGQQINVLTQAVATEHKESQDKDKALAEKEAQLNLQSKKLDEKEEVLKENASDIRILKLRLGDTESKFKASESKLRESEKALQDLQDRALSLELQLKEYQKQPTRSPAKAPESPFTTLNPHTTFQPQKIINQPLTPQEVKQNQQDLELLFKWVTEGHLEEAEKLLQKNPNLALMKGTIKDLSGRKFTNTSGFQYAAWALDIEMCELMLNCFDRSGASAADTQLTELEKTPGTNGAHYDIDPLLRKTQEYISNYSQWDYTKRCQHWQKEVGGEQRKCPAWLIYAWCEKGDNVAWVKKDLKNIKVVRQYNEGHIKWWFEQKYNEGAGVGTTWAVVRGILRGGWPEGGLARLSEGFSMYHDRLVGQSVKPNRHEALTSLKASLENKSTTGLKK